MPPATPVTIYTTPTCPFCKATKEFLKQKNVSFQEIDITSNPSRAQEVVDKSGQMGVPVTIVKSGDSEKIIVGYDLPALRATLKLA